MDNKKNDELTQSADEDAAGDAITEPVVDGQVGARGFDFSKELYDWAQALVYSIVFIVVLFTFFVRIIGVDGASMEPTLHNNDKIVVTNLFYTPEAGDIIVLRKESFLDEPIVKRVIATEGQTINIDFITHEVSVDGVVLDEPYINAPIAKAGDVVFPVTIPEGYVFVLGDNRNNSADSRLSRVGVIDMRYILGQVIYRVFPLRQIGDIQ